MLGFVNDHTYPEGILTAGAKHSRANALDIIAIYSVTALAPKTKLKG